MKKSLTGIILLALVTMLVCAGTVQAGFVQSGGNTMYQADNGSYLTGLQKIGTEYYYFNSTGILQKNGWIKTADGKEYFASESGTLLRDTWIRKTVYLKSDGEKAKGITKIGTSLYYFSPQDGTLQKGKLKDSEGNLYITNKRGVVYSGKLFRYQKKRYYADETGKLAKGLTKIGNDYYFFRLNNGRMVSGTKKVVGKDTYYFTSNGKAAVNRWVRIRKQYYYFLSDGRMAKSQFIGKWYVDENGVRKKASDAPKKGVNKIDGKIYVFDASGKQLKSQWAKVGNDTYYLGADGAALIGMQTIGTDKYYFNEDGVLQADTIVTVDSTNYVVDANGRITGTTDASGSALVEYAKKFLGLPYVWGGTSLTTGADCSGFCMAIHNKFGIQLMRVADDQRKGPTDAYVKLGYKKGTRIADNNLAPGDLVFYCKAGNGVADHVAMYIGNNKVIHEAGSKWGCITSDIDWAHGRMKNQNMRYWA